jgi:hypothetical protein
MHFLQRLFFPILVAMSINGAPRIVYECPTNEGISCFTPESEQYRLAVSAMGDEMSEALTPILPFGILVRNDSTLEIIAVRVVYRLKNWQGKPIDQRFMLMTLIDDPRVFVNQGQRVLMFPQTGLSRKVESNLRSAGVVFQWSDRELYASQETVTISVDAVAFRDGVTVGPDRTGMVETINSYLDARAHIEQEVLATVDESTLRARLQAIIDADDGLETAGVSVAYKRHKGQIAKSYLALLNSAKGIDLRAAVRSGLDSKSIARLRKKRA